MKLDLKELSRFEEAVMKAKKIFITPHKNPDGDALGGSLSLYLALTRIGKDVTIGCVDPVPDAFKFLPGSERMVDDIDPKIYDLVISVDAGDTRQLGWDVRYPELWDGSDPGRTVVKIDHHPFARDFGDIRLVYTDACASCYILTEIYDALGIRIRPDMATCLLNGLHTDTGSFKHDNTTPDVLRMAARLMRAGANLPVISKEVFHSTPISAMRLWGHVLSSLRQTDNGITLAVAKERDFDKAHASQEDLAGVVDYINAVPNAKFSMLLSERGDLIKGSLRTKRDDVNVAKIASTFGGGGHVKAAGFAVPGRLEKVEQWKIVNT